MAADPNFENPYARFGEEALPSTNSAQAVVPTRGVLWVLRWAVAMVVLFHAAGQIAEFSYCISAEHSLARAARAGAVEATLPRATNKSIAAAVSRRLGNYPGAAEQLHVVIQQNNRPSGRPLVVRPGDQIVVHASLPAQVASPRWLRKMTFWQSGGQIEAHAERRVPGRQIAKERLQAM